MRVLLQRVSLASVAIDGETHSLIGAGLLLLLSIDAEDDITDIGWMCAKISRMRVFPDSDGKMNLSIMDTGGEVLVVSQFTLHASTRKGNRPSFLRAAPPSRSEPLYETFCEKLGGTIGKQTAHGVFGAEMKVALVNDGPVTIWIDSRNRE